MAEGDFQSSGSDYSGSVWPDYGTNSYGTPYGQSAEYVNGFSNIYPNSAPWGSYGTFGGSGAMGAGGGDAGQVLANRIKAIMDEKAAARAYQNAVTLTRSQQASNLSAANFTNELKLQNASRLTNNAQLQQNYALQERDKGFAYGLMSTGGYNTEFANSGVQLNTGSTKAATNYLMDQSLFKRDATYISRLNNITNTLQQASDAKVSGQFDIWNAKEKNRFMDAELIMSAPHKEPIALKFD